MNEKIAKVVKVEKKIKVQATDDMKFFRFPHFKELTLTEYRALKNGEIIELTKTIFNLNKNFLKEIK